jgi:protein ImuA
MRPEPPSGDSFTLARKRVHEAEGRGRRAFALFQAARHPGPLVWILPAHAPEMPMLRGLPSGVGERLHLLRRRGETDLLWCLEEALPALSIDEEIIVISVWMIPGVTSGTRSAIGQRPVRRKKLPPL